MLERLFCASVGFSLIEEHKELKTVGQSNVPEQLGHDKTSGSQPRYLQYWYVQYVYLISFINHVLSQMALNQVER